MPVYKCSGKDCKFSTEDLEAFIDHKVDERVSPPKIEEPPKKKHETVADYLNCPECFPKFEAEFLKRGYKKPEPQPPSEKKGGFPV